MTDVLIGKIEVFEKDDGGCFCVGFDGTEERFCCLLGKFCEEANERGFSSEGREELV